MSFNKFNFSKNILESLEKNKYEKATKIQDKVIPLVFEGKDVIAKAQTGSGKTASFVLPILQKWQNTKYQGKAKISTLVVTPTRELTLQVCENFKIFSQDFDKKPKIVSVLGGESLGDQLLEIQKGCDIVVATSGRLSEIIRKKQIDFSKLEFFVLDEADKMLDLGFVEELDLILDVLPSQRQNLLFSATYSKKVLDISLKITKEAIDVQIEEETIVVENIKQRAIEVNRENRAPLLRQLLKQNSWKRVLVFMANNKAADNIAAKFRKHGFNAESFHGNLEQEDRVATLEDFKDSHIDILFSSDIAARGLHIDDIDCVINYDLPRSPSDYVHRIGRTARAGKSGIAISFITLENHEHFKLIEKRSKIKLQKEQLEGFELVGTPIQKKKGQAPVKGKRKSKKDKLREKQAQENK